MPHYVAHVTGNTAAELTATAIRVTRSLGVFPMGVELYTSEDYAIRPTTAGGHNTLQAHIKVSPHPSAGAAQS
jgi:hypothetical protein